MASFSQQLKLAIDASKDDVEEVLQSSVIALMSVAIQKTPVDKGRARNNWFCNLGDKNVNKRERSPKASGQGSISSVVRTVGKLEVGGKALLYNNLPYIERLENGYSNQAPTGMVRAAVASWGQIVELKNR